MSVLRSSPVFLCARTGCLAIAGYNREGVTGFPVTKLDSISPLDLSSPREQSPFVSVSSFSLSFSLSLFFLSKPTALTNCFRSQFNRKSTVTENENVFERIVTRTIEPQTSRKARRSLEIILGFLTEGARSRIYLLFYAY